MTYEKWLAKYNKIRSRAKSEIKKDYATARQLRNKNISIESLKRRYYSLKKASQEGVNVTKINSFKRNYLKAVEQAYGKDSKIYRYFYSRRQFMSASDFDKMYKYVINESFLKEELFNINVFYLKGDANKETIDKLIEVSDKYLIDNDLVTRSASQFLGYNDKAGFSFN